MKNKTHNKYVKRLLGIAAVLLLSVIFTSPVSANHAKEVLGDSISPSDVDFPQIASGPGFFLPDSPLYFLDKFSQSTKIFFAFSPERKAQIRSQIAGERLAELRVMLERNNEEGIDIALDQFTKESDLAASQLSDAGARSGKDIRPLAKELNTTIKSRRKVLRELERQTSGELRLRLRAARESLRKAKIAVEDELPAEELEKELQENIEEMIEDEVDEASRSARGLEHAISVLERLASQAAEKDQPVREAVLLKVINRHNAKLESQEQRRLEREQRKKERIRETNTKAITEARETVKKAQEAAQRFRQAKDEVISIENEEEDESVSISNTDNVNSNRGSSTANKNSDKNQ